MKRSVVLLALAATAFASGGCFIYSGRVVEERVVTTHQPANFVWRDGCWTQEGHQTQTVVTRTTHASPPPPAVQPAPGRDFFDVAGLTLDIMNERHNAKSARALSRLSHR